MRLILCSASPYRAELLRRLGLPFEQIPGRIDETPRRGEEPAAYVKRLAIAKARAARPINEPALIIGSLGSCCCNGSRAMTPRP